MSEEVEQVQEADDLVEVIAFIAKALVDDPDAVEVQAVEAFAVVRDQSAS